MRTIRRFLAVEALAFLAAALIHAGFLLQGYEHRAARLAETVLALVLLAGLTTSRLRPALSRAAGLAAQGLALLGTLVGILTMIVGVGPQSTGDVVYHAAMVALLVWGLVVTARMGDVLR